MATPVHADLTFIVPQDTKPYFESSAVTGGPPRVHYEVEHRTVAIHDARALAGELHLDREGFTLRHAPSALEAFPDEDAANARYDREIEALLKSLLGARAVHVFDRTRRSDAGPGAANRDGHRGPAGRVHVDYTPVSGPRRAADVIGQAEVYRILSGGGRIVQINVWRPMSGPVRRSPLALADARSVAPGELVATDQIFPDRVGEIFSVAHGAAQRWYWVPEITPEEVILIKGWDSLDDGRARFTPHGAFELPEQDPAAPARQSIEVRTYVVIE